MKKIKYGMLGAIIATGFTACTSTDKGSEYVNLSTNEGFEWKKDTATGMIIDVATGQPVDLYVDTKTKDTIWGRTGKVVNGRITKSPEGKYTYIDMDADKQMANPEVKVEADGDVKVKEADGSKEKFDNDGDYKNKDGDTKVKVDKDGDVKIKNGDTKTKIDADDGNVKTKKTIKGKIKDIIH